MAEPGGVRPTGPDGDNQGAENAVDDAVIADADENIEAMSNEAASRKPEQADKDCEKCGRSLYFADGTWWHLASGTVDGPDVSQWWGTSSVVRQGPGT